MAYNDQIRKKAFLLWCQGKSLVDIARTLKIKREQTLTEWKRRYDWEGKRGEIDARTEEKLKERVADDLATRLLDHGKAGRGLRALCLRALNEENDATRDRSADPPPPPGAPPLPPRRAPDALKLQRIGMALRTSINIERQALGLDVDGRTDQNPLDRLTQEELEALYEAAKDLDEGQDGETPSDTPGN